MATIDWIIAGLYFIGTIAIGIRLNKKTDNTNEFFSGGKDFAWWAIAGSVIATQVSAVTFVGAPGWAYNAGLSPIVLSLNITIVMWFIGGSIVPFFYNSGVVSIYEYMEGRFGYGARATLAVAFLIKLLAIMGVVIFAPALVLSHVTGLDIVLTILIMTAVIFVTSLGGLTAVIWIDVMQIVILWIGIITSFVVLIAKLPVSLPEAFSIVHKAGKLNAVNFSTDWSTPNTIWAGVFGGLVLHVSYFGANQAQVQRMLAAKSIRNLKLSLWSTGFAIALQMLFFLTLGLLLFDPLGDLVRRELLAQTASHEGVDEFSLGLLGVGAITPTVGGAALGGNRPVALLVAIPAQLARNGRWRSVQTPGNFGLTGALIAKLDYQVAFLRGKLGHRWVSVPKGCS